MTIPLQGLNPLSYMGVEAEKPVNAYAMNRRPTTQDKCNFVIGDMWVYREASELWTLVALANNSARWVILYPGAVGAPPTFMADVGMASPAANILNMLGGSLTTTTAAGNTVTIDVTNGANGQVIIGGGSAPVWANITSLGGTITIINGANSIDLRRSGTVAVSFPTDAGTATPNVAHILNVLGGTNINTTGAGNVITVNLDNNVDIPGTLTLSFLGAGLVQTTATGVFFSDNGTNGQVMIGGGTEPNWGSITSVGGTITITPGANTLNIDVAGFGGFGNAYPFLAVQTTDHSPAAGSTVSYTLGTAVALTTVFDLSGGFYGGDGAGTPASFTAPVTGKWCLQFSTQSYGTWTMNTAPRGVRFYSVMTSTSRTYTQYYSKENTAVGSPNTVYTSDTQNVIMDLAMGDTVTFQITWIDAFSQTFTLKGAAAATPVTWVSGFLIQT